MTVPKLQIILPHFCIPTHRQPDQQRVINRTVIVRIYHLKLYHTLSVLKKKKCGK